MCSSVFVCALIVCGALQEAKLRAKEIRAVEDIKAANATMLHMKAEQRQRELELEERIKGEPPLLHMASVITTPTSISISLIFINPITISILLVFLGEVCPEYIMTAIPPWLFCSVRHLQVFNHIDWNISEQARQLKLLLLLLSSHHVSALRIGVLERSWLLSLHSQYHFSIASISQENSGTACVHEGVVVNRAGTSAPAACKC